MHAVVAAALVWSLARIAFRIGYHIVPQHRVGGLVGVLLGLFICAEIVLIRMVRR